jgi:hypothetical protein
LAAAQLSLFSPLRRSAYGPRLRFRIVEYGRKNCWVGRMLMYAYNHARLMEESESRVEMTAYLRTPADTAASRVLQSPEIYRRWESEHDRLMRTVSEARRLDAQITRLRATVFGLVHRRALFDYLSEKQMSGARRHRLLALFYGCRDYSDAVLTEYGNYIRCSSSYVCTQHLGENLMRDTAFKEPLQLYEAWYSEYFRTYCDVELAETENEKQTTALLESLKPLLKHRLSEARHAILAMPQAPEKDWREVEIRKPNGDTQRMRTLFGSH